MLGKTYLGMKDRERALHYLTKAKEYPAHTQEEKEVRLPLNHLHGSYVLMSSLTVGVFPLAGPQRSP